jgi:hypothetical protein
VRLEWKYDGSRHQLRKVPGDSGVLPTVVLRVSLGPSTHYDEICHTDSHTTLYILLYTHETTVASGAKQI